MFRAGTMCRIRWRRRARTELGIPFEKIAKAMANFDTARRRFEIKYAAIVSYWSMTMRIIDRIRATLATARSAGRKRVLQCSAASLHPDQGLAPRIWRCFDQADRVVIAVSIGERASHSRDHGNHCRCHFRMSCGVTINRASLASITMLAIC